ncbi:hydrogenase maturation protease [Mycobacterium sp. CBMA293]|uniref:hydrogenase maturation protease n=1 Tax=unclassified Mycolicibacterium TaxID=2636767 RepID=UPI0012DDB497|nr:MULTISPECIES: hydrogenase maturation protease [unclassified Mycolicibacterium]MUL48165.1 hydrogenase maturation protease [Mycolicibacterium sp. CBMA 360]MUL57666.1 hydrogenase maturation protease [Mycolicibacterium sp. CBMA 335]MUL70706.1 hydrogenase maturation protease [Mycolicibacterium sp. CBMA 311]MUL92754.1 hydrogenase maturation protease [Mycolicibacterium sp. CBMA 230]MUM08230.1 peptidase M52 [Mycolicibacterium sp. CBMA 213]
MRAVTCACGGCDGGVATQRVLVAGIGNIFLGDDGFGPEVLRHLDPATPSVQVTDYGIRGMHLAYDLLAEWGALVLVDALPCRGAPGAVHVFEADHQSLTAAVGLDAHAMDPATVFASLNALGGTAPYTVVVGCEVTDVEERMGLSDAVAAAVPTATRAVENVVAELISRTPVREG